MIGSERLGDKPILESNQARTSIDRPVDGGQEFPSGSPKSGNTMNVDFRLNEYE